MGNDPDWLREPRDPDVEAHCEFVGADDMIDAIRTADLVRERQPWDAKAASERAKAARAYILDGLKYAVTHGWPDKPMMGRAEVLALWMRLNEQRLTREYARDEAERQHVLLGATAHWHTGYLGGECRGLASSLMQSSCLGVAHEFALAEKREREDEG